MVEAEAFLVLIEILGCHIKDEQKILTGCHRKVNNFHYHSHTSCDIAEVYSEPCQTSKIERFAKIVNGF